MREDAGYEPRFAYRMSGTQKGRGRKAAPPSTDCPLGRRHTKVRPRPMRVKLLDMQNSLRLGKRALTIAVATLTMLWSVGVSAFVAPLTASAASAGSLIKGTTLSTVYYLGSDGSRYAFPNEKTYFSWY